MTRRKTSTVFCAVRSQVKWPRAQGPADAGSPRAHRWRRRAASRPPVLRRRTDRPGSWHRRRLRAARSHRRRSPAFRTPSLPAPAARTPRTATGEAAGAAVQRRQVILRDVPEHVDGIGQSELLDLLAQAVIAPEGRAGDDQSLLGVPLVQPRERLHEAADVLPRLLRPDAQDVRPGYVVAVRNPPGGSVLDRPEPPRDADGTTWSREPGTSRNWWMSPPAWRLGVMTPSTLPSVAGTYRRCSRLLSHGYPSRYRKAMPSWIMTSRFADCHRRPGRERARARRVVHDVEAETTRGQVDERPPEGHQAGEARTAGEVPRLAPARRETVRGDTASGRRPRTRRSARGRAQVQRDALDADNWRPRP